MATLVPIKYVGLKPSRADTVAGTGLIWTQGQIHAVPASLVPKFQKHPDIWQVVTLDDENIANLGLVVDTLGETMAEVTANQEADALVAAQQAEAKQTEQETVDRVLTTPELPQSFDPMSKSEIAAFAQRTYGLNMDPTRTTKDDLIKAVRDTHQSRVTM